MLSASQNGLAFNNVHVVFKNDGAAGSETATYDTTNPADKTLTVHIPAGQTTAAQVVAAINAQGTFQATVDYRDESNSSKAGFGTVSATDFGQVTTGGTGQSLDTGSGLIISNGGQSVTLDTSGAKTVEDLLNLINGAGVGVVA